LTEHPAFVAVVSDDGMVVAQVAYALNDRELYLAQSWTEHRQRGCSAGLPDWVEFATKPRQAQAMPQRAIDAALPFAWVTADAAYGHAKYPWTWLEDHDASYVPVRRSDTLITLDAPSESAESAPDVRTSAARSAPRRRADRHIAGAGVATVERASARVIIGARSSDRATLLHKPNPVAHGADISIMFQWSSCRRLIRTAAMRCRS
jgi:SRSO17 transposase